MESREELIEQQKKLLEVYEKVKDMLKDYPNVVDMGIGVKEKGGKLTEQGCIKVMVREKKSEKDLSPNEVIPKVVEGVPTDVFVLQEIISLGACTDDSSTTHRPIKGGAAIENGRTGRRGTMGCLAQLDDNSWVILSNWHVLYGDIGRDEDDIGQPRVGCCWCCKTNLIAKNHDTDKDNNSRLRELDCAIAKVNDDIAIDNSILEIGDIQGNAIAEPVFRERVRKRGAASGLTSGNITYCSQSSPLLVIRARGWESSDDPGGCPNRDGGNAFAYRGDSGSVLVNDNNEVVGLLYSIGMTRADSPEGVPYPCGLASDIRPVQNETGITIKTTSSTPGRTPASFPISEEHTEQLVLGGWSDYIEENLKETLTGSEIRKVIQKHEAEIFNLVNKCRPVTVVWQRKQGPAFLAAFGRSVKHSDYEMPKRINHVTLQNLLMSMAAILEEHGSEALRHDLAKYALEVIRLSRECNSSQDFLNIVKRLDSVVKTHSYIED